MKKTLIALLLVLIISSFSVFAVDDFSFSALVGYDFRGVKAANDSAHSMCLEIGAKYPLGDGFYAYTDAGIRFAGKGKFNGAAIDKGLLGYSLRAGVLYGVRFVNNPEVEAYAGGGVSFANTKVNATGDFFTNMGIGFKLLAAYRISDSFALVAQEVPDIYIFNRGQFNLGFSSTTSVGAMFKF